MEKTIDRIDLHLHTTVSDGTDTPEELLSRVREAGIDVFSVTDHDSILSGERISALLGENDPLFITGVEFSCRDEKGKYHILGYGYDPKAEAIFNITDRGHALRMKKTWDRLEFLEKEFGFEFSDDEVYELLGRDNPGKPHIAKLMVKHGYASSIKEAIDRYIDRKHFPNIYIRPEEAIRAIEESGGIPVLAHPSYGSGNELVVGKEMEERLQRLTEMGLRGVEAYYSGFTLKLQEEMLTFADEYHLYVTAGSDYHGQNKLIELGDNNLKSVGEAAEGLQHFLEDVHFLLPQKNIDGHA